MQRNVVMIVDDEQSIRTYVRNVLEREGLQIVEAVDGREAFNLLQAGASCVSLILTDITMPRLDGIGLGRLVKALFPELPVLFMSGDPHSLNGCGQMALQKPFTPKVVRDAVFEMLRTHDQHAAHRVAQPY